MNSRRQSLSGAAQRVFFVNRFAHPDEPATAQLLEDLAGQLQHLGFEVCILASRPAGAAAESRSDSGLRHCRIRATRLGKRLLPLRLLDFATFLLGVCLKLRSELRPGDAVVSMSDPPLLGSFVRFACLGRRSRRFHWLQDLHPEVALRVSHGFTLGQLARLTCPLRDWGLRGSCVLVVPGEDMARLLERLRLPVVLSSNWAPEGLAPAADTEVSTLRSSLGLSGRRILMYSGNLGRVHANFALATLFRQLSSDPNLGFVVAGSGPGLRGIESLATEVPQLRLLAHQPREQLSRSLSLGDLHLVTLRPGCEDTVYPSKLYGITAVGRPVLFLGPTESEIASSIREGGFGLCFPVHNIAGAARAAVQLLQDPAALGRMGAAALAWHRSNGGAARAAAQWQPLLDPGSRR